MIVKTFIEPPIDNNNYLIVDESSREAALIDCSAIDIWDKVPQTNGIAAISTSGANRGEINNIHLKYILLTHGHFDHIAGLRPFNNENPPKVFMNKNDLKLLNQVNNYLPMFGMSEISIPNIDRFVEDGDIIKLGNTNIQVLHTPGHTQGSVCYLAEGKLFSGDTIFREAVGRCDLEGGDFNQIVESIESKIYTLPDDTEIYPGHGKPTNVGWEKIHNRFL